MNGKPLNRARSTASSSTLTRDSARKYRRVTPKQSSSRKYDMSYHLLDDMLSMKDKSGTPEVSRTRKRHSQAASQIGIPFITTKSTIPDQPG